MNLFKRVIFFIFSISCIFSQISINPSELHFGSASIGASVTKTLTVTNSSTELLSITNITCEDNQFYAPIPVANIPAFSSVDIDIVFIALSNGLTESVLSIETNNESMPTIDVPCSGSGASIVTGEVSGTWSLTNSPIYIQNRAYLLPGSSLYIEPGVEVVFADSSFLTIAGTIIAQGTTNAPIVFRGNGDEPSGTIELYNIENETNFYGCIFENLEQSHDYIIDDFNDLNNFNWYSDGSCDLINEEGYLDFSLNYDIHEGSNCSNTWTPHYVNLYSDLMEVETYNNHLQFDYILDKIEYDNRVWIYYQINEDGNWVLIQEWFGWIDGNQNQWNEYTFDLSENLLIGDVISFRIEAKVYDCNNNYDDVDFKLDNIRVEGNKSPFSAVQSNISFDNSIIRNMDGFGFETDAVVNINYSTLIDNANRGLELTGSGFSNLTNSIIYFNDNVSFQQIANDGILNIEYSNIQGLSSFGMSGGQIVVGAGNIESNPVFSDNEGHLSPNSPCVDSASSWEVDQYMPPGMGTFIADMGAYGGPGNDVWGGNSLPSGDPMIHSIQDIPHDQGGYVGIQYSGSIFDHAHSAYNINEYSFWRELDVEGGIDGASANPNDSEIYVSNRNEYWEHVGLMDAQGFENYGYTAPTIADSTASGDFISTFLVIAHTDNEDVYFSSLPASGRSIDNLAPAVPVLLSGEFNDGQIDLLWSGPEDQDFALFNIYRNNEFYTTTIDSQFVDLEIPNIQDIDYQISSIDHNGNESELSPAITIQAMILGDLNGDFSLNVLDVVMVMEHILEFSTIDDISYADMNEDGIIDILDVVTLVVEILAINGSE